ncbi:MAG: zinc ribbon domain-containing protein [Chloroflexi bacterium]|nr:zinc ribbon domain-containing protein [Chloroflexota bacterium]
MALDASLAGAAAVACPQCNALNPAGNKFCRACGTRLPVQEPTAVETTFASSYPAAVPDVPQLPSAEERPAAESAEEAAPAGGESEPSVAELPQTGEMPLLDLPQGGNQDEAQPAAGEEEKAADQRPQAQGEPNRDSAGGEEETEKAVAAAGAVGEPVHGR